MKNLRSLLGRGALLSALSAVLLASGCDNHCREDGPEPAPGGEEKRKASEPAAAPAQDKPKVNEAAEIEQLKRDIEELRKRLKSQAKPVGAATGPTAAVSRRTLAESLARIKKNLDGLNSGYVTLLQASTEELVRERSAIGKTTFVDLSDGNAERCEEIRRILISRLDSSMTRADVHGILGEPELVIGGTDYYSRNCFEYGLCRGPLDFSLSYKHAPRRLGYAELGLYYRI